MNKGKGYTVLILSALLTAGMVYGEDLVTNDGTVYKDIKITEVTPIGINFISNEKACWVDFRDLPAATATQYGYDAAKAAQFEKMLAQNNGSTLNATTNSASASTVTANYTPAATAATTNTNSAATTAAPTPATATTTPATATTATATYAVPATATGSTTTTTTTTTPATVSYGNSIQSAAVITPPVGAQVVAITDPNQVIYNPTLAASINVSPETPVWVYYGGYYYPAYTWNYWFWNNYYIPYDGRYYPARYFHGNGAWYGGRFYPYAGHPGAGPVVPGGGYRPGPGGFHHGPGPVVPGGFHGRR